MPINNVQIHVLYLYINLLFVCVYLIYMYMCGECVHVSTAYYPSAGHREVYWSAVVGVSGRGMRERGFFGCY